MAGVMAHELSHVVLRRCRPQSEVPARRARRPGPGSIVGGTTGAIIAQGSQLVSTYPQYSREHEREADLLGAQIAARRLRGGDGPDSDHPTAGRETREDERSSGSRQPPRRHHPEASLTIAGADTGPAFDSVRSSWHMPSAPTTQQVARAPAVVCGQAGSANTRARALVWFGRPTAGFGRPDGRREWMSNEKPKSRGFSPITAADTI